MTAVIFGANIHYSLEFLSFDITLISKCLIFNDWKFSVTQLIFCDEINLESRTSFFSYIGPWLRCVTCTLISSQVNVEDLMEAAIQRCYLKMYFLRKAESWKWPAYILIFLKSCRQKACSLAKNNFFRILFQGFFCVLRFIIEFIIDLLFLLMRIILWNTYQWMFASRSNFKKLLR